MTTPTEQREDAVGAADGACPRCGAPRVAEQEYCVECGLRLPTVTGRLPALRRGWIRRVGWYPGDWVWISLLTLLVAIAGAVLAILVTHRDRTRQGATVVAPTQPSLSVHEPTPIQPATTAKSTAALPVAPEPTTTAKAKTKTKPSKSAGGAVWPAHRNGWTIVLVSYPKTTGATAAHATVARAQRAGLHQVGILDSSLYASLQPGYLVVFTGIYGSQGAASASLATAHGAGFAGAYVRQVAG